GRRFAAQAVPEYGDDAARQVAGYRLVKDVKPFARRKAGCEVEGDIALVRQGAGQGRNKGLVHRANGSLG
nr:hypothetical protein [Tanacetum cinerariifolium]